MSAASKANDRISPTATSVPTRVAAAAFGSGGVDGAFESDLLGFSDYRWRVMNPDRDGEEEDERSGRRHGQAQFTPLVGHAAGAFPATQTYSDSRAKPVMFITDFLRGLGVYEFNMKMFAGTMALQGSVCNRVS